MELIKSGILYNYDFGLESEYSFYNALNESNSIVLMGSSELLQSDTVRAMPFNFIPKNSHFNLLAIGTGGNQCFSIFTQLYSARKYLDNSKIVIIISPNWFIKRYGSGTSLASFFEFNNNRFLHRIINNSSQNDLFKNYIGEYIVKNYSNIESNNTLINYFYYKHLSMKNNFYGIAFFPIVQMLSFINNLPIIIFGNDYNYSELEYNPSEQEIATKLNIEKNIIWNEYFENAIEYQKSISTNNDIGMRDDYYNIEIKQRKKKRQISLNPIEEIQEYKDFKMLLKLLAHYNADATFVIQALNPYFYDDLNDMKPIIDSISYMIKDNNFPLNNQFIYKENEYEIGVSSDAMHLGALGWYRINKFIIENYN